MKAVAPRQFRQRGASSYAPVFAILVLGIALSVYAFFLARQTALDELRERFLQHATERIFAFERDLKTDLETVKFIGDFYGASLFVDRQEFQSFVQRTREEKLSLRYMAWAPRTGEEQVLSLVDRAQADGFPDFRIRERSQEGALVPVGDRPEYFPLLYLEPLTANRRLLGYDLRSDPVFWEALEKARDSGELVASTGTPVDQGETAVTGFLAFWPIYTKWQPIYTLEQRRRHLQGFAIAALRLSGIVSESQNLDASIELPINLNVYDPAAPLKQQTLYGAPPSVALEELIQDLDGNPAERFRLARRIQVGGRSWLVVCDTDPERLSVMHKPVPWIILALGLLFTLTLVSYLGSTLSRSATIQRKVDQRTRELAESNNQLEKEVGARRQAEQQLAQQVEERTRANRELETTLEQLNATQDQLVQAEKMASLGELVAGVAHEINTPVGVSVTAASTLRVKAKELGNAIEQGNLKRSHLNNFLVSADQSTEIILGNLERAAELIQSFKQVAVDQSSSERRRFEIKEYVEEILLSLRPQLKKTRHRIELICEDDKLSIDSYPGTVSQILTNLIMNSLIHAYNEQDTGVLTIEARAQDGGLQLRYADDGKGIPKEHLGRIFDPFFTTRRGAGGSGLGMHIVYNLVTQKLGGKIRVRSELGKGTEFLITIPMESGGRS